MRYYQLAQDEEIPKVVRSLSRYLYPSRAFFCAQSSRLETWRNLRDVTYHDLPISGPGLEMSGYRYFTQRRGGGPGGAGVGTF